MHQACRFRKRVLFSNVVIDIISLCREMSIRFPFMRETDSNPIESGAPGSWQRLHEARAGKLTCADLNLVEHVSLSLQVSINLALSVRSQ